jgi:hypothetical protein
MEELGRLGKLRQTDISELDLDERWGEMRLAWEDFQLIRQGLQAKARRVLLGGRMGLDGVNEQEHIISI